MGFKRTAPRKVKRFALIRYRNSFCKMMLSIKYGHCRLESFHSIHVLWIPLMEYLKTQSKALQRREKRRNSSGKLKCNIQLWNEKRKRKCWISEVNKISCFSLCDTRPNNQQAKTHPIFFSIRKHIFFLSVSPFGVCLKLSISVFDTTHSAITFFSLSSAHSLCYSFTIEFRA